MLADLVRKVQDVSDKGKNYSMDLINRSAGMKMKNDNSKWARLVFNISKKVQRCLSTTLFMMKVMEMVMFLGINMAVFSAVFINSFKWII